MTCQVIKSWNALPSYSLAGSLGQCVPIAFRSIDGLADWMWTSEPGFINWSEPCQWQSVQPLACHKTPTVSFASLHYILFLHHRITVGAMFYKMFDKPLSEIVKHFYMQVFLWYYFADVFSMISHLFIHISNPSVKYHLILGSFCSKKDLAAQYLNKHNLDTGL